MRVDVDTHDRSAGRLQRAARPAPAYETNVFASVDAQADARIEEIIAANSTERGVATAKRANGGASAGR
jgi:glucose-6-phosphate dehydrogenase assembly protein OpcA